MDSKKRGSSVPTRLPAAHLNILAHRLSIFKTPGRRLLSLLLLLSVPLFPTHWNDWVGHPAVEIAAKVYLVAHFPPSFLFRKCDT